MVVAADGFANLEHTSLMRSDVDIAKPENLVRNGDFESGISGWTEYKHQHRRNGMHLHHHDGRKLMHLHGSCPDTGGGAQQQVKTTPGRSYTLKWTAFTGFWDHRQDAELQVKFGDFEKTYKVEKDGGPHITATSVRDGKKFEETVTTSTEETVLSFWSPVGHCMDIDDVELTLDPTTTTTAKSGLKRKAAIGSLVGVLGLAFM